MSRLIEEKLDWVWSELDGWLAHWKNIRRTLSPHGDMPRWERALTELPAVATSCRDFGPVVAIGRPEDVSTSETRRLERSLAALHPWRKGPFRYFGTEIDTEWRSDQKWQRLARAISPLSGRKVLDVGCGNGYYGWRMLAAGADRVIGIDPTRVFFMQYLSAQHYLDDPSNLLLPLALENLPRGQQEFDSVFSMGVLSHRRDPIAHLGDLQRRLKGGGELILETLIIDGEKSDCFKPAGRYARMRNVWLLPTPPRVLQWLEQAGFRSARLIDVTATTPQEQRSTAWMKFESLAQSLDPDNPKLTVEGYPGPTRAIFIASP